METQAIVKTFKSLNVNPDDELKLKRLISLSEQPSSPTKIVVFGQYNHGKSSFLNAWFENDSLFSVSDKRETREIQKKIHNGSNTIWFDTPGLDADDEDDSTAKEVLQDVDILCFVHHVDGELDQKEIQFLKEHSSLVEKSILLLTKIDQKDDSDVNKVREKIEQQLLDKKIELKVLEVSSERYRKFLHSGKEKKLLGKKSNFASVKKYLSDHIAQVNKRRSEEKMYFSSSLISILEKAKKENQANLSERLYKLDRYESKYHSSLNDVLN